MKSLHFRANAAPTPRRPSRQHFGAEMVTLPCAAFEGIFAAIDSGEADFGVLPVENSLAGSINRAYDLLLERDLRAWAKSCSRAPQPAGPSGQRWSRSTRCVPSRRRWPNANGGSASAACRRSPGTTRLAAPRSWPRTRSRAWPPLPAALAAETYGLAVLASGIEDLAWNYTRFFVIGRGEAPITARAKTSLVFAVTHEPGWLVACLNEFSSRGINLTKIESRPRRNRPWHYVFYLDFDGHWQDPACQQALVGLLAARPSSSCWALALRPRCRPKTARPGRASCCRYDLLIR